MTFGRSRLPALANSETETHPVFVNYETACAKSMGNTDDERNQPLREHRWRDSLRESSCLDLNSFGGQTLDRKKFGGGLGRSDLLVLLRIA